MAKLTEAQLQQLHDDGYTVVPQVIPEAAVHAPGGGSTIIWPPSI